MRIAECGLEVRRSLFQSAIPNPKSAILSYSRSTHRYRRAHHWNVTSAALIWKAKSPVTIDDDAKRAEVEAFLSAIDEDDDVQNIYVGLA